MTQKIDGIGPGTARTVGGPGTGPRRSSSADKPVNAVNAADSVRLTDSAEQLRALEQQLAEVPVVDSKRVQEVRQELAEGRYQVNAETIARKLLQTERELSRP
ncbi:MAG: flagellar biosynthesis anti-sigma factor FlgM [Gammaproteobacteria bacterium]|nr:flagellar biosynthesis anti-sigma factor FlgM [Gammaproteobacteria bacterium]